MSEWHTPVAPISTMTSLGYGPSSCTSTSRSGWCGCAKTADWVIGADSQALAKYVHADGYDPALPADAEQPGYGVRPEFDADMAWQFGMRPPIIAAVNGACAGIAVALVAFCDIRFAVEGAKITTAAPTLGLPAA